MKINSHCWLRTALQRLQCIFIISYSNKRRTAAAALIRGWRLLTFPPHVRRLIEGGAYSGAALIRVNTVFSPRVRCDFSFSFRFFLGTPLSRSIRVKRCSNQFHVRLFAEHGIGSQTSDYRGL